MGLVGIGSIMNPFSGTGKFLLSFFLLSFLEMNSLL